MNSNISDSASNALVREVEWCWFLPGDPEDTTSSTMDHREDELEEARTAGGVLTLPVCRDEGIVRPDQRGSLRPHT